MQRSFVACLYVYKANVSLSVSSIIFHKQASLLGIVVAQTLLQEGADGAGFVLHFCSLCTTTFPHMMPLQMHIKHAIEVIKTTRQ